MGEDDADAGDEQTRHLLEHRVEPDGRLGWRCGNKEQRTGSQLRSS